MINREASQYTMLGLRLREMREHFGLTQARLAAKLEVSVRAVGRWERGGNGRRESAARFLEWRRIATALKVAPDMIFHPVGAPIRTVRGKRVKRHGQVTVYEPLKFSEAQAILQCSPRVLARLINQGEVKVILVQMIKARSLYRYIAKRGGYNGG